MDLSFAETTIESVVAHAQQDDEFDKRDQRGNEGPTENEINQTLNDLSQIEFVYPKAAEKEREQRCGDAALSILRGATI